MYVLNHLDRNFSVTDKKKIIGLRHIIVDDYDKVNDAIVYAILKKNLILLRTEVEKLLNK